MAIEIAVNAQKEQAQQIKDVRAQKFPRWDFFKILTVGRKW